MTAIPAPDEQAAGYGAIPRTTGSSRLGLALVVIASAQLMVVLDATIVNVALPHVQRALGFSGSGLEWVVNAYAVTFGGLLLLGGRAGDRLGRRRVFVAGLLLFSAASLLGGFATSQWWLLTARAVQGAGGAVIAPTALSLITTNFPEGEPRNRALGVYSAMAGGGAGALSVRSPRTRIAFLAAGQTGWVVAGLGTQFRGGIGATIFLLGALVVAATAAPAAAGAAGISELAISGLGTLRPARAAALSLAMLSLAGAPPLAGFFGEFTIGAALARSGHFELLAVGMLGSLLSLVAAIGTVRVLYLQNPPEEGRRGLVALPVWTRFSAMGAIALCVVIAGYGLFANPIFSLADQGAEALGLR